MKRLIGEYDFQKADGIMPGMMVKYSSSIVSPDGANYHLWVPRSVGGIMLHELKNEFKKHAQRLGDPVSFTWDFEPIYKVTEYARKFVVENRYSGVSVSRQFDSYFEAWDFIRQLEKVKS